MFCCFILGICVLFWLTTYYRHGHNLVLLKFTTKQLVWHRVNTSMRLRLSLSVSPRWQRKPEMTSHPWSIPTGHWKIVCVLSNAIIVRAKIVHYFLLYFSLIQNAFKVCMTQNFLLAFKMMENGICFFCDSTLGCWVIQDFDLCQSDYLWCHIVETKYDVKSQKMEYLWRLFLYRTETLNSCYTHHKVSWYVHCDISMATQWSPGPPYSKGKIRVFLLQEVLFTLAVHSVGVSKHGHHTAQVQESLLDSGATNMAFFILGRPGNKCVPTVTS